MVPRDRSQRSEIAIRIARAADLTRAGDLAAARREISLCLMSRNAHRREQLLLVVIRTRLQIAERRQARWRHDQWL